VEITIISKVQGILKFFVFHAVMQVTTYIPTTALCTEIYAVLMCLNSMTWWLI